MISASELKRRGVAALEEALSVDDQATIAVRGKAKFVALPLERYRELLDEELALAVKQAEADLADGRAQRESAEEHIARLGI
jgi:PHD/YefM family antitoxin component YafN of YafNO toxin-antitoxin module